MNFLCRLFVSSTYMLILFFLPLHSMENSYEAVLSALQNLMENKAHQQMWDILDALPHDAQKNIVNHNFGNHTLYMLFNALTNQDAPHAIRRLAGYGANFSLTNASGNSALHEALALNNMGALEALLDGGAPPNIKDSDGYTTLHRALIRAHAQATWKLIQKNANVNLRTSDENKRPPLHCAVQGGSLPCVKLLLEAGARIDEPDAEGKTALLCAAESPDKDILLHLLKCNALLRIKDDDGFLTPLYYASMAHFSQAMAIAEYCLLNYKELDLDTGDCDGLTCFHVAAGYGAPANLNCLIAYSIRTSRDPLEHFYKKDKRHWLLIHYAVYFNTIEMLECIKQHLAYFGVSLETYVNMVDNNRSTPLFFARTKETIDWLVAHGAKVSARDVHGGTALHYQAVYGTPEVIEVLVRNYGFNLKAATRRGNTPLKLAQIKNKTENQTKLIELERVMKKK